AKQHDCDQKAEEPAERPLACEWNPAGEEERCGEAPFRDVGMLSTHPPSGPEGRQQDRNEDDGEVGEQTPVTVVGVWPFVQDACTRSVRSGDCADETC